MKPLLPAAHCSTAARTHQKRYAHITTIRTDRVNPELLGMTGVASEDSVRRALSQFDEAEAVSWLDHHLAVCSRPVLGLAPWVLDTRQHGKTVVRQAGRSRDKLQSQETGETVSCLSQLLHGQYSSCVGCRSRARESAYRQARVHWSLEIAGRHTTGAVA